MDSVSAILTTLDAAITSAGRQYFEATAGGVGPIYTTLLALLLVMVGINAALNVYRISMRDAVQLSFRIVMVLMFGLTWSNFTQIYDAASNGLSALALLCGRRPLRRPRRVDGSLRVHRRLLEADDRIPSRGRSDHHRRHDL